jgi:hypothetical protein
MKKTIKFQDRTVREYELNRNGFIQVVSFKESSADLSLSLTHKTNLLAAAQKSRGGHRGFFQMGEAALFETGYYLGDTGIDFRKLDPKKEDALHKRVTTTFTVNDWKGEWTGKNNIFSLNDFISKPELQLKAVNDWINYLCKRMRVLDFNQYYGKIINGVEVTESGAIAAAHLMGEGGLATFLNSPIFENNKYDVTDSNGTHISLYLSMFGGFDLETCCNRKIYIQLKDKNGMELKNKEVIIVSSNNGKYVSGETRVKSKSDEFGKLPVIIRNPNTQIKIVANGKESNPIIQKADQKQRTVLQDFEVSKFPATLEENSTPQPKPQPTKTPQEVRNEQNSVEFKEDKVAEGNKDVRFNIQMIEGDTGKPISKMNFFLTYKGNIKKHTADSQGIKHNIIAEVGQDIEVSVSGESENQKIHHFKVEQSLSNKTIKIKLPVQSFKIIVKKDDKIVKNLALTLFYRGIESPKKTNSLGEVFVNMLVGFVYGFGVGNKSLTKVRVIHNSSSRIFRINEGFEKASKQTAIAQTQANKQQPISAPNQTSSIPSIKPAEVKQEKPNAIQQNTHTENGGKPLTIVRNQAPPTSDTTRYHIYHDGKIKRENKAATGFSEYIYYDSLGKSHNLGKSKYVVARRWSSKNVLGNGNVYLVDVRHFEKYRSGVVGYKMLMNSRQQRYYLGGLELAAFLGALCKSGYDDISFNGFSTFDGGAGESKSHINGEAGDIRYLRTDKKALAVILQDENYDHERSLVLVNNFIVFGWGKSKKMLSEYFTNPKVGVKSNYIFPRCNHLIKPRHNNHLHLQGLSAKLEDI